MAPDRIKVQVEMMEGNCVEISQLYFKPGTEISCIRVRIFFGCGQFLVALPANAESIQQELLFNPSSKSWVKRPAGSLRENANRKWANASPVAAEVVPFKTDAKPGTIIIRTAERRLYLVRKDGMAKKYGIGVGREGFAWTGSQKITRKAEWPSWTPPAEMKLREAAKGRVLPISWRAAGTTRWEQGRFILAPPLTGYMGPMNLGPLEARFRLVA